MSKQKTSKDEENKKALDNSMQQSNFVASRMRKIDADTDPKQNDIVEFILKPEIETFKQMKALYPHQSTIFMDQPFGYYAFNKLHPERFYKAKKFYNTKKFKECSKIMNELISKQCLYRTVYSLMRENELNMLRFIFRNRNTPRDEIDSVLATSYDELRMKDVPISNSMCEYVEETLLSLRLNYGSHRCQLPCVSYADASLERTKYFLQVLTSVSEFLVKLNECKGPAYHKTLADRAILCTNLKFILENIRIVRYYLRQLEGIVPWDDLEFFVYIYLLHVKNSKKFDKFFVAVLNDKIFYKFIDKFVVMLNDFNLRATLRDVNRIPDKAQTVNLEFINFATTVENLKNLFYLNKIIANVAILKSIETSTATDQLVVERVANIVQNLFEFNANGRYFTAEIFETLKFVAPELAQHERDYNKVRQDLIEFSQRCVSIRNYERFSNLMNFIKLYERRNAKYLTFVFKMFANAEIQELFDTIHDRATNDRLFAVTGDLKLPKFRYWNMFVLGNVTDSPDSFIYTVNCLKQLETDLNVSNAVYTKIIHDLSGMQCDDDVLNILAVKLYKCSVLNRLRRYKIRSQKTVNAEELFYQQYVNKFKEHLGKPDYNRFLTKFNAIKRQYDKKRQFYNAKKRNCDESVVAPLYAAAFDREYDWSQITVETTRYEKFIADLTKFYTQNQYIFCEKQELVEKFVSDIIDDAALVTRLHAVIHEIYENDKNTLLERLESLKLQFTDVMASFETYSLNDRVKLLALEMLAVKLFEILVGSRVCVLDRFLADSNSPLLCGMTMNTYLIEGDLLHDILSKNPYYSIKYNLTHYLIDSDWKQLFNSTLILAPEIPIKHLAKRHEKTTKWLAVQNQMYISLKTGDLDSFREQIEKEADIRGISFENKSVRHYLCRYERYDLELESNVSKLHNAVLLKQKSLVLANVKKENLGVRDTLTGKSSLHFAVDVSSAEMVKLLLHEGLYVDSTDSANMIPLFHAIKNNDLEMVKLLVEKNSNPLKLHTIQIGENSFETNAFQLSLLHANKNIIKFLFEIFQDSNDLSLIDNFNLFNLTCLYSSGVEHLKSFLYNVNIKFDINKYYQVNNKTLTLLHGAVYFNNEGMVKFLLNLKTCDYNLKTEYAENPLHLACMRNDDNLPIVELLLEKNVDYLSERNQAGDTPLDLAIVHNNYNIVMQILKNTDNAITNENIVNSIESNSYLILSEFLMLRHGGDAAIEHPNLISIIRSENILKLLYPKSVQLFDTADHLGNTILHYTAFNGNLNILKYFDEISFVSESNLNAKNLKLKTPFHLAVEENQGEIIKFLIAKYSNLIDFNVADSDGNTPLYTALLHNYSDLIRMLIDTKKCTLALLNRAQKNALHMAIDNKNYEIIEFLLDSGWDLNRSFASDNTPLVYAIAARDEPSVKILLSYGVDVNLHNPLHLAIETNSVDICRLLIEHGANVNSTNSLLFQMTPLHLAAYNKTNDILKLLLKSNALPNYQIACGSAGDSFTTNELNFLRKSVGGGAGGTEITDNVDGTANELLNEKTALHFAVENNNIDAVKMLVSHGASVNRCCSLNRNPLGLAKLSGHANSDEIQSYLIKNGAIEQSESISMHLANILGSCNVSTT